MLDVVNSAITEIIWYVWRLVQYIVGSTRLLPLFVIGISISVIFLAIHIIRSIIST